MPRNRGNSAYKPTRYIILSGATFASLPSGVTIQRNQIETTGVTIAGSNIQSSYGYPLHIGSVGVKVISGTTLIGGTSEHWLAASFGLSTLTNLVVQPSYGITPSVFLNLTTETGVGITCYAYVQGGQTKTTGTSVDYFAVGT